MALPTPAKPTRTQSYNVLCTVLGTTYTLYTCPANCKAEVTMLMLNNVLGNISLTAIWNDVSTSNQVHIVGGKNLTAGDSILFTGATLVLDAGDSLTITLPGTGSCQLDGLCTVSETFRPIG